MDRNEQSRRHKQNVDARSERRNGQRSYQAQQRGQRPQKVNRQPGAAQRSPAARQGGSAAAQRSGVNQTAPRPAQAASRPDHAPVYDQDYGRTPAPQPQKRRGKKGHVHVTKKELRRRARRRRMLAVFLVLAAVVSGAVLSVSLLFKVTSITVQNPAGYVWDAAANSAALIDPDDAAAAPTATPETTPEPSAAAGDASSDADAAANAAAPEGDTAPDAAADAAAPSDSASRPEGQGSDPSAGPTAAPTAEPAPTATPEPTTPVDTGPYTQLQITAALGVQLGDNMFSFNEKEKEEQMALALPLLEKIDVRRQYPNTLVVQVTPAVATWYTPVEGGWLVLSESLKVMEQVAEQPQGLPLLLCDAKATQPGTQLATRSYDRLLAEYEAAVLAAQQAASDPDAPAATMPPDEPIPDENRVALDELMAALDAAGILADVTALDTVSAEEIGFLYQGRVSVLLGTTNQMDYKMEWATTILRNEGGKGLSQTDAGVLDISHIRSDGTIQPVFRQGEYPLPSQQTDAPAGDGGEPQTDPDAADGTAADPAATAAP